MKTLRLILCIALAVTLFASSAYAWRSVRTGQKNFERAWSAVFFKRPEQASGYFAKAADAFASALAEQPPSRTTMFASNLAMAGISFYYAGRYDQCIETMGKAVKKDKRLWEASLYTALSQARLGEKESLVESLNAYLAMNPGQSILSDAVKSQLDNLENQTATVQAVADEIDRGAYEQFNDNITFSYKHPPRAFEQCNSSFWWRYSRTPCKEDFSIKW